MTITAPPDAFLIKAAEDLLRQKEGRADAGETMSFARQLEQIIVGNFDYRYPDAKAFDLFSVDRSHDPTNESWTYRQYQMQGQADRITNYATDFPAVSAFGQEFTAGYESFGASYGYSIDDLRRAARPGGPQLDAMKARAARRVIANTHERISAIGVTESQGSGKANQIWGALNSPNVALYFASKTGTSIVANDGVASPSGTAPTNSGTSWAVSCATSDPTKIIQMFESVAVTVSNSTKGVFSVNRLILPLSIANTLKSRKWNTSLGSDRSIWDVLVNSAFFSGGVESWIRAETAGTGGTPRCMFTTSDKELGVKLIVPTEFEQFAPQTMNLAISIPCRMRTGGAWTAFPLAHAYVDGFS